MLFIIYTTFQLDVVKKIPMQIDVTVQIWGLNFAHWSSDVVHAQNISEEHYSFNLLGIKENILVLNSLTRCYKKWRFIKKQISLFYYSCGGSGTGSWWYWYPDLIATATTQPKQPKNKGIFSQSRWPNYFMILFFCMLSLFRSMELSHLVGSGDFCAADIHWMKGLSAVS